MKSPILRGSIVVAGLLAGCPAGTPSAAAQLLDQVPIESATVNMDFQKLAACVYDKLDGPGLKKADFPNRVILALDGSGVRYWQLSIESLGQNRSSVKLSTVRTIWGPDRSASKNVMPSVAACSGT